MPSWSIICLLLSEYIYLVLKGINFERNFCMIFSNTLSWAKAYFLQELIFSLKQNQEQKYQTTSSFQTSVCWRSLWRVSEAIWGCMKSCHHKTNSNKRIWVWQKKLFRTSFADRLCYELPGSITKWGTKIATVTRLGNFADSCSSFQQSSKMTYYLIWYKIKRKRGNFGVPSALVWVICHWEQLFGGYHLEWWTRFRV